MWFHSMTRDEQQEYKNKNRPPDCKNCEEYPIHSNDGLKTWMCGNCKYNAFKPNKKALGSSSEHKREVGGMIVPPKKIVFS